MALREFEKHSVGAIICSADEKIIMGTKVPGTAGAYAGPPGEESPFWVLPGGIVESGQTPQQAILAEILEETGLRLADQPIDLIDDVGSDKPEITLSSGERIMFAMKFSIYGFSIELPADDIGLVCGIDEMSRMEWIEKARLGEYNLCPPSIPLFQRLGYLPAKQLLEPASSRPAIFVPGLSIQPAAA